MITDEFGAQRYTMTVKELSKLYVGIEDFIADCTRDEVDKNREAINTVLMMIHQHINSKETQSNKEKK